VRDWKPQTPAPGFVRDWKPQSPQVTFRQDKAPPPVSHPADIFTGSGVVIGTRGEILTNSQVVESCERIIVRLPSKDVQAAALVARDKKNDLAVVRINNFSQSVAAFQAGGAVRAGDAVVALGYPLSGLLATSANLTVGKVSALAGLGDDSRYLQISAPVQPGNSGGPLLDTSAHLVGIVTSKLNAAGVARVTGDIPQNVNFAIKAEVARAFLDSNGVTYRADKSDQHLSPADVGDMARLFTVYIECHQAAARLAAVPTSPTPPPTSGGKADAGNMSVCLQIQRDARRLANECIKDEVRRLTRNQTEPATVIADAIIGRCRANFFYRRNEQSTSREFCQRFYDHTKKVVDDYFAEARSIVVGIVIDLRTE
jgi:Trypsin-like peptidase domain